MTSKFKYGAIAALIISGAAGGFGLPATAGELTDTPSYNWIGAGYAVVKVDDDQIGDLKGLALFGSFEPVKRLVIQGAIENGKADLDPALGDFTLKGSAIVGTVGTYFPLSERVHLTADIGFDYEEIKISGGGQSAKEDFWYANAVVGITAKTSKRTEFSAQIQRLEGLKKTDDSNWVGRVNGAYSVSNSIDLVSSIAYENDAPAFIIGARARF